eukprot:Awhi_evm1s12020
MMPVLLLFLCAYLSNIDALPYPKLQNLKESEIGERHQQRTRRAICNNNQECREVTSGYFQGFADGFCQKYNQCNQRSNSNCHCVQKNAPKPVKNYLFEQASGVRSSAYYPYRLPSLGELGENKRFGPGIDTVTHSISNVTYNIKTITYGDQTYETLGDIKEVLYSWANAVVQLSDTKISGYVNLLRDVPAINYYNYQGMSQTTDLDFRVMKSGTYQITVNSNTNYCTRDLQCVPHFPTFDIKDVDYHPSDYVKLNYRYNRWKDNVNEKGLGQYSDIVTLQVGHTYSLSVYSPFTGVAGETPLTWDIRLVQ